MTLRRSKKSPKRRHRAPTARELAQREAILDTAAELFFQHGYDVVSVGEIVGRVGGSKGTVYRHFKGKDALLEALVERETIAVRRPLEELKLEGLNLEPALRLIGKAFLDVVCDERAVALHRLVIAQGHRFPHLAATFLSGGPEGSMHVVGLIFRTWQQQGRIKPGYDCELLARQFLDLLKVNTHAQLLLGMNERPSEHARAQIISEAINLFLWGVASDVTTPPR